jgi:molybdopterin synthase sulfur carrier subunit
MRVSVLYFAGARELAGVSEETIELDEGATIARALEVIVDRHPSLAVHLGHLRVARNEAFATTTDRVEAGDVLALIPPVAGG